MTDSVPASTQPHMGTKEMYDTPATHTGTTATTGKGTGRRGRGALTNIILALLLAIAIALAAAPASGYKSGWAYFRRSNYVVPPQYGLPAPVTLKIWVGWIKGSNSIQNILHAAAPDRFPEYTYVRDVEHGGLVASGLAIGFLLLSGLVGFVYFLVTLIFACTGGGRRSAAAPGLPIAGIAFGILNCLWSIVCYIVLAVGAAKRSRQELNRTHVAWPDWCFFLGFFSGIFWFIIAAIAFAANRKAKRSRLADPAYGTHNMAYGNGGAHNMPYGNGGAPHGTTHDPKTAAV